MAQNNSSIDHWLITDFTEELKVPTEAIVNFDEEKAIYAIQNNYDNSTAHSNLQYHPRSTRYEALLKAEREKSALLERLLNTKG